MHFNITQAHLHEQNNQIIGWEKKRTVNMVYDVWILKSGLCLSLFFFIRRPRWCVFHHKIESTRDYDVFVYNLTCCVTVTMNFLRPFLFGLNVNESEN